MYLLNSKKGKLVLLSTILVSGLAGLLGRMVAIALPIVQDELKSDFSEVQWVINGNLIVVSVFTMMSGSIADRFGLKRIFLLGIGIFSLGCLLATFAPNINLLILSQGVTGMGMVLMVPSCLAIINRTFEETEKSRAIGIWRHFWQT